MTWPSVTLPIRRESATDCWPCYQGTEQSNYQELLKTRQKCPTAEGWGVSHFAVYCLFNPSWTVFIYIYLFQNTCICSLSCTQVVCFIVGQVEELGWFFHSFVCYPLPMHKAVDQMGRPAATITTGETRRALTQDHLRPPWNSTALLKWKPELMLTRSWPECRQQPRDQWSWYISHCSSRRTD